MDLLTEIRRHIRYFITITLGYLHYHYTKRFTVRKPKANLQPVDDITKVSENVTHVLAQNPGPFTLQGTNTYLVSRGPERILIDAGEPNKPEYIAKLAEALGNDRIMAILCTHRHRDHIGGVDEVKQRFGTPNTLVYKLKCNKNEELDGFVLVEDGYQISVGGCSLTFVESRGHTSDHAALWLEEERILFSGDCVLGEGSSIFDSLSEYMNSLEKLQKLDSKIICPGHGPMITNPKEKMEQYISHRIRREKQIIAVLEKLGRANPLEVTQNLYSSLPKSVQIGAFGNIRQTLDKLLCEGRVARVGLLDFQLV